MLYSIKSLDFALNLDYQTALFPGNFSRFRDFFMQNFVQRGGKQIGLRD